MKFNLKALAAAAVLATASTYGVAASDSFDAGALTYSFESSNGAGISFSDTFTLDLVDGLAPGVYSVLGSFSATNSTISSVTVNGMAYDLSTSGPFTFGSIQFTDASPLVVSVTGLTGAKSGAYSGELVLTAVPEPETYALMLGGLGALGFMIRRRRNS